MLTSETRLILGIDYFFSRLKPVSPYGQALKNQLAPFRPGQEDALERELTSVGHLLALLKTHESQLLKIRHYLAQIPDWREPLNQASAGGVLSDVELFGLKQNLFFFTSIKTALCELSAELSQQFHIVDFPMLVTLLDPDKTGSPSFYLSDSFSSRLSEVRAKIREQQRSWNRLTEALRQKAAELVNLKFSPSGEIAVPRHDRNLRNRVEDTKLFVLGRETYTELYYELKPSPQELSLASELDKLRKQEDEEEEKVRQRLSLAVKQEADRLRKAIQSIAQLDLTLAKAILSREWECARPEVTPATAPPEFVMERARHPKVADDLASLNKTFTPISISLRQGVAVITGANMGGKTVTLRTVGMLAALTAYGIFVPAEYCRTSLFAHISILAGEYRAELTGLSRFGHEIASLNDLLLLSQRRSLLLIDELASSTNPTEGSALAQAVVEFLKASASVNLLTTHYDRLAHLPGVEQWQVIGLSQVQSKELAGVLSESSPENLQELSELMDYRLTPVEPAEQLPREALRVAKYLGLPEPILSRASSLLREGKETGNTDFADAREDDTD